MFQRLFRVIEIKDLTVEAEGRTIVSAFSLRVERGGIALISGPSGSGKSIVLKTVLGFVEPISGEIAIEGLRLDGHSIWQARCRMAYVPQELDMGDGTARDALVRPFKYKAASSLAWDEGRARELFSEFGLEDDVLDQDVKSLSGGEKQRVAFVSALLLERPVLILDEVTTGLDRKRKKEILQHLKRRVDLTVLAATHDEAFLEYANQVVSINPPARKKERE